VGDDGRTTKVPSTPADPSRAVLDACRDLEPQVLAHGTTVATNALLERRLGRVALVATRGFADVLEIARQARPSLYDAHVDRPVPLVPRDRRVEVSGRLDARGAVIEPFDGTVPGWATSTPSRSASSMPISILGTNAPSPRCCAGVGSRWCARTRCRPSSASTSG
jgi:N-methylhydantoinase A